MLIDDFQLPSPTGESKTISNFPTMMPEFSVKRTGNL